MTGFAPSKTEVGESLDVIILLICFLYQPLSGMRIPENRSDNEAARMFLKTKKKEQMRNLKVNDGKAQCIQ